MSRDTTESDLKQRREISSGTAYYVDQCAVRAATKGRVLLLEGIEKAERNVLPVLNNLLENRLVRSEIYFMILIFIYFDCYCSFWEKFLLKRFLLGINIVAWLTSYCTSSREMQLEDGRFLMAAERYDSLLKVWPLLTLSEFYFYGLTSTYTSTWIVISLRGHVTSFQKIIISIKINNQSKTQNFTSMWQFTYC